MRRRVSPQALVAALFLMLALPLAIRFAIETAPFDTPDEPAHFLRAVQVADGGLRAVRLPGTVGGLLPAPAVAATGFCALFRVHPALRSDARTLAPFRALRWGGGPPVAVGFTNTAGYPPVFYAPEALAIAAGRRAGFGVLDTFTLGRIADAVVATATATLALAIAEAGVPWLAAVLALPMTMSLFGSASQDAMLIAVASLGAAVLTRWSSRPPTGPGSVAIGVLLGAVVAARPPYGPLLLLPIAVGWRTATGEEHGGDRLGRLGRGAIASAIGGAVAVGWLVAGLGPVAWPTQAGGSLFGGAQMHWLLAHPGAIGPIAEQTVGRWRLRFDEFVGVLGWLDIPLPGSVYRVGEIVLLVAFALTLGAGGRPVAPRGAVLGTLALVAILIELALYLAWSPLGAPRVEGVQGRYFIPPLLFAALLGRRGCGRTTAGIAAAGMATMLMLGHLLAIHAVVARG